MGTKALQQVCISTLGGAIWGIIIGWVGNTFEGETIHNLKYAVTVKLISRHNAEVFTLTTIYGPCHGTDKEEFINWFSSLEIDEEENWIFMDDFNFYRSQQIEIDKEEICQIS